MTEQDTRPIVVGVDESAASRAALAFAVGEALVRGVTVEVVTTWLLGAALDDLAMTSTFAEEHRRAQECQDAALADVLSRLDERPVISQIVVGSYGGHALVEAARDAALLVVGSERKGMLSRALLGSVSEYCVRHAHVPVVVVPDPALVTDGVEGEEIASAVPQSR